MMTGLELIQRIALEHEVMHGDVECESRHEDDDNRTCSGEVTHRAANCKIQANFCHNAYASKKHRLYHGAYCADCLEPAAECWRFLPI